MKTHVDQLKQIFRDALAQPAPEAENDKAFQEWLELLRADIAAGKRGPRCASYRAGKAMIKNHLKPPL